MNGKKRKKISPAAYNKRNYRQAVAADDLVSSFVTVKETDLHILAAKNTAEEGCHFVHRYRNQLENYIAAHPEFLTALVPLKQDTLAPPIVKGMLKAAAAADVGPMAAVAGAIAEFVGRDLLESGLHEVMVENGGDIFLARKKECVAAIFAGQSPLNQKVGIRIPAAMMPVGLCTSSGTIGHSLSLGKAAGRENINDVLALARNISGLLGVVIICGENMGVWGQIDLVGLD